MSILHWDILLYKTIEAFILYSFRSRNGKTINKQFTVLWLNNEKTGIYFLCYIIYNKDGGYFSSRDLNSASLMSFHCAVQP